MRYLTVKDWKFIAGVNARRASCFYEPQAPVYSHCLLKRKKKSTPKSPPLKLEGPESALAPVARSNLASPDWGKAISESRSSLFRYNTFISLNPYLWVRWVRPLEPCLRRRSGFHQRADSARQFPPPRRCWTAGPSCRLSFSAGRSCGSSCPTRTAGRLLDRLRGSTGAPGCYCVQDNISVKYQILSFGFTGPEDFSLNYTFPFLHWNGS